MQVEAVVFDMDGVLVDTEVAWLGLFEEFFGDRGLDLEWEELCEVVGGSLEVYKEHVAAWWKRTPELSKRERKMDSWKVVNAYCKENFPPYTALLFPGVRETLAGLSERGIRLAVASSSSRRQVEDVTRECGIDQYFELVVSGQDFTASKPDPAVYLRTLELLDLPAEKCIAVEDSDPGIAAARAAHIPVAVRREERFGAKQEGGTWYLDELEHLLDIVE